MIVLKPVRVNRIDRGGVTQAMWEIQSPFESMALRTLEVVRRIWPSSRKSTESGFPWDGFDHVVCHSSEADSFLSNVIRHDFTIPSVVTVTH